jgi:hypothetical protein
MTAVKIKLPLIGIHFSSFRTLAPRLLPILASAPNSTSQKARSFRAVPRAAVKEEAHITALQCRPTASFVNL